MIVALVLLIAGVTTANAMTNAEIQQNIISRLYKGESGRVSCDYDGYRSHSNWAHEGMDIVCRPGATIYAVFSGTVTGRGVSDTGVTVLAIYNSEFNVTIVYEHANFSVSKGATINVGDRLGTEAANGTDDAHTHFELRTGKRTGGASNRNSTLENPNPYPYYAKMFGGTPDVDHIIDGSYPTPINAVPRSTSSDIQVYDVNGNAESNRWISPGDRCTINAVYTDGWLEVTYPSGSGSRTAYVKKDVFFASNSIINSSWSPSSKVYSYAYSNLTEKLGEVWTTDRCVVVGQTDSNYQVIYPLSGGGYKLGWVSKSSTPDPVPIHDQVNIPGPVAAGIFDGKAVVVMAPTDIVFNSKEWISAGDICILTEINPSTGYCDVTYPSGGDDVFTSNWKEKSVAITYFIEYQPNFSLQKVTADQTYTVYPTSSMQTYGRTWYLDPGDEYYTVARASNGATQVLYYCTRGAHAGYWKLGWVDLPYYSLDLNGWLDGASAGDLGTYGAADVYVNGNKLAQYARDFYSANGTFPRGSSYEIKNIVASPGYTYNGVHSGSTSGTLLGNVSVYLDFSKNPVTLSDIWVTQQPSKLEYLEGQNLDTAGLKVEAVFSDGTTSNVTSQCSVSGYDSAPGVKTVMVTYGGKSTAFTVVVKSKTPTGLVVSSNPTKTRYRIGEELNLDGLKVMASYDNGTSEIVDEYEIMIDEGITSSAGTKAITVLYDYNNVDVEAYFEIVVVQSSLVITAQPSDYTGPIGTKATFTVVATGTNLSYQWQWSRDNGATWTNSSSTFTGYRSASMQVPITEVRNGYLYRCIVADGSGVTITSNPAKLTIGAAAPTITAQPSDYTGSLGSKATFTVTATGEGLTYQWQWSRDNGKTWTNSSSTFAGYRSASMQVPITEARDGYLYRCIVTGASGAPTTSDAAKLTIGAAGPAITAQPSDFTGALGTKATFAVAATGSNLTYQWQWSRDNGKTWTNSSSSFAGYRSASMQVPITEARNGYLYRCIVTDASGKIATSDAAKLTVAAAPSVAITSQPADFSGALGSTATFTVAASGSDLSYQWQWSRDNGKTWTNSSSVTPGYNTAKLSVPITAARDGYLYRCIVYSSTGDILVSNSAKLTVTSAPKLSITGQPKDYIGDVGDTANFSVVASGEDLTYQWQYCPATAVDDWRDSSLSGCKTSTLSVQLTPTRDGQKYRCIVKDSSGNTVTSSVVSIAIGE